MVMLAPVFGAQGVPTLVRIALTASFSFILYPIIANSHPVVPLELLPFVAILIKEILVGLVIGFVIYAFSAILQGAGQLIDIQVGFAMANTIDPFYGAQTPLMGKFNLILATMILLATNAHHFLVIAMVKSYTYVPINTAAVAIKPIFYYNLVAHIFTLSVQLALPIFGAIFLADVGLGLLSRAVPQLNIFTVVFPVKIGFGFILLMLSIPFFGGSVTHIFNSTMDWLLQLYRGWLT